MVVRNVNYVRAEKLSDVQKSELGLSVDIKEGIVAIESHNPEYKRKGVLIKRGITNYILNGD